MPVPPEGADVIALLRGWWPDPDAVVALAVAATIYTRGVQRSRRRTKAGGVGHVSATQVRAFAAALLVASLALLSPLDAWSADLFAAHMTQHVLLATVVPPLAVLGGPVVAALWACPRPLRRRVMGFVRRRAWMRRAWWIVTAPVAAWLLHAIAIWTWHAPSPYELALHSDGVHALEHLSFVGTGTLLWWSIIHPRGDRRTGYAVGILTIFATAMQTGVLGALFTLSPRLLYTAHPAAAATWGLTPLDDQQLAGLIMWVPGGLLYVVAMSVLFVKWLEPPRRAARVAAVAAVPTLIGCSGGGVNASRVPGGDVERGRQTIAAMGCGACHTIDGVSGAHGQVGPPLTGMANRAIVAGKLPNTPENMMRWIENPPAVEPNTAMPNLGVGEQSARDIVAYLYTLR